MIRTLVATIAMMIGISAIAVNVRAPEQARERVPIVEATIAELQAAMTEKRVTSLQLVQQYLHRIATYEDRLNAVITVNPGGTLSGSGTAGAVVTSGGTIEPGSSAGTLSTGSVVTNNTNFHFEIGGLTPGNGPGFHDQINTTGTIALDGTLVVSLIDGFVPATGDAFLIWANDTALDPVTGTFAGLPEGGTFPVTDTANPDDYWTISYTESAAPGSDGNDISRRKTGAVYRDGEGRTRQESGTTDGRPRTVYINDPVAHTNVVLSPGSKRAVSIAPRAMSYRYDTKDKQVVRVGSSEIRVEDGKVYIDGKQVAGPGRIEVNRGGKEIVITAGNSCPTNDGASAALLMSERKARELRLEPLARIVGIGVGGVKPQLMGVGPIVSTRKALAHAGIEAGQIDRVEFNEAFAAQVIPSCRELGIPLDRVNVNGGSIAIGHPLGATGARLVLTVAHELRRSGGKYGLATQCIGAGMGISTIIEAV